MISKEIIDPKKSYTLGEIVKGKMIPGVNSIPKASRLVKTGIVIRKVLKAKKITRGENGVQYKVKGETIIKFVKDQTNG